MNNLYDELRFYTSADALVDHWLDLQKPNQTCPQKKDFSPMRMGKFLPDVFLAEWQDDDHVMIRVAGSRTKDVTRVDTTGMNMLDICLPEHRPTLQDFYRRMRTGKVAGVTEQPLLMTAVPSVAKGLQLPLGDEGGDIKFFVGVTKAIPINHSQLDFRLRANKSVTSLHMWFTNLSVQNAPMNSKIG